MVKGDCGVRKGGEQEGGLPGAVSAPRTLVLGVPEGLGMENQDTLRNANLDPQSPNMHVLGSHLQEMGRPPPPHRPQQSSTA